MQFYCESLLSADNMVELAVFRHGELGQAEITWSTGTSSNPAFIPGSIVPASGTLPFPGEQNMTTFTLTVSHVHMHTCRHHVLLDVGHPSNTSWLS